MPKSSPKKPSRKKPASLKPASSKPVISTPAWQQPSKEKVQFIIRQLNKLYKNPPIPLKHKSTFQLLVAVLLSAQSTDKTVNRITPQLFAAAPTPKKMRTLSEQQVYEIIKPCGLGPKKAAAICQLSEILLTQYQGQVPQKIEQLEQLPGVGHKTASVVVSQAFGQSAFAVDTHVHRLAARWKLSTGKNVAETERHLKQVFSKHLWSKLHLQMIFFGREHCPAKNHDPNACPICSGLANF